MAISSPLLETSINGAGGLLINITGSADIGLEEVEQAARSTIGMIKADTDQAVYLRSTTEDLAVILDPNRKPATLLRRMERLWDRMAAYLSRPAA